MSFDNHFSVPIKAVRVESADVRNEPHLVAIVLAGVIDQLIEQTPAVTF